MAIHCIRCQQTKTDEQVRGCSDFHCTARRALMQLSASPLRFSEYKALHTRKRRKKRG